VTDLTYRSSMYKQLPSGMSAPLSRRRKAERIGLMPDGVREFAHDAGCDAEHFQERDRRAACLLARLDRKECVISPLTPLLGAGDHRAAS